MKEQKRKPLAQHDTDLAGVVHRNIQALIEVRREFDRSQSWQERLAAAVTSFTGSMLFVAVHVVIVTLWFLINTGMIPGIRPFDPYPFVMLAMAASVEAIFLSTFVLISQNQAQALADRRDELNLQISLLAEHEVTQVVILLEAVCKKLEVPIAHQGDLEDIKKDIAPEKVLAEIEQAEDAAESA